MKIKIAIALLMAVIWLTVGCLVACDIGKSEEVTLEEVLEKQIIKSACNEIEIDTNGATTEFLWKEPIPWAEGDMYAYILNAENKHYLVGVRRTKTEIFTVDLEQEIEIGAEK